MDNLLTNNDAKQTKEQIQAIVNSVLSKSYSFNAGECATFRRAAGKKTDELDMGARIFLQSLFDEKPSKSLRDAILIGIEVLCLQKQRGGSKEDELSFKEQTARLYKTIGKDKSFARKIEDIVKSKKDGNARFYKDIVSFCQYLISKGRYININSLVLNIYYWDTEKSKEQWVDAFSKVFN